ncbi:hypothetical protein CLV58_13524 [Spirosoma oryzae]|uniref:Uncharacterized protein n=1 Tax=Spirosoma oryzae TaxID=1469603 RepID=A0A2T0S0X6_9BACT|nr:hypothetical protein [Spirosoma oryzae]PRY27022.1 hypothetical protein CLV58_13524 [Spirosoma oryzae]
MQSRLRAGHLLWPVWLAPGWIALWLAVSVPVDGQAPLERTTDAQRMDTSRTSQLRGLGIFGKALGIHGQDSLLVAGDLVLDRAEVVGEGVLLLKSRAPQQLIARHSTLINLAIDNPTQVTLRGDLRVKQSLTVKEGTLIDRDGNLTLDPTCQTTLLAGGQLRTGPIVRPAVPLTRLLIGYPDNGLTAQTPSLPVPLSRTGKRGAYARLNTIRYASLAGEKPVPPPEMAALYRHR